MRMTINFKPWIGDDYRSGSKIGLSCKLMLLGESHYGGREKSYPDFTKCVIREYVHGDWTHRYFTTLQKAVLGSETDPKRLWQFVAFYNFIQDLLEKPGAMPEECMWEKAKSPFRECLECLHPTHVIACGFRLWDHLPGDEGFWKSAPEDERNIMKFLPKKFDTQIHKDRGWLGRYQHGKGECLIVKIKHPSVAFSWREWHPMLKHFLQLQP